MTSVDNQEELDRLTSIVNKPFVSNPFWVLKLQWNAQRSEIRAAYRSLSLVLHPDKNGGSEQAQDAFSVLNDAFSILTDAETRKVVDAFIDEAKGRASQSPDPQRQPDEQIDAALAGIFIEQEEQRVRQEDKKREERQQARVAELALQQDRQEHQVITNEWEQKRVERVDAWKNFSTRSKKKKPRHA